MHARGTAYLLLGEKAYVPAFIKDKSIAEAVSGKQKLPENPIWCTVYVAAGKKDKINKMDIVGLFLQKGKLQKDELGLIEVLDHSAYIAVRRNRVEVLLKAIKNEKIKNKSVKIGIAS